MGFFSGLETEAYDRQYSDRQLVRRIADYFRPHIRQLGYSVVLLLVIAGASASLPILVSRSIDILQSDPDDKVIYLLSGAVFTSGVIVWGVNWIRRRIMVRIIGDVVMTLRTDGFKAASEHDLSFYDRFSSGRIVSRITSDTRDFGQLVVLFTDLFSQVIQAIILSIVLIRIEWRLALGLFAFLPILFFVASRFRDLARKVTRRGMRAMANVNATIKESVSGIAVAKNFRQEETILAEFSEANISSYKVNLVRGFVLSLIFPTLNALIGIGNSLLVYIGGIIALSGIVTIGAWLLFLLSLDRFFFPVLNLSAFWAQVQSGLSSAERVFALIDAESVVVQKASNPLHIIAGDIRIKNLHFRYTEQEQVFNDFNLHIKPGESVALVGHTGAGKSSIAKLIARFYEFQDGQILIDGQDIRSLDLTQYRSQLGIVSQIPFLFSGTVIDNICYACSDAGETDIEKIAMQIGGGEWLETLPKGLNTEVGERGSRLSMGQRQLVSLLRVLVQQPAVFILDEATASIDPFTEWQIQEALKLILANRTSILIAHRLSTVKAADRIIVLENGQVIEEGDHESLMTQSGHYATLYDTYFRHQSLAYVEGAKSFVLE